METTANMPWGRPPGPLGALEALAILGFRGICSPELLWACPWRMEDNKEVWPPDHQAVWPRDFWLHGVISRSALRKGRGAGGMGLGVAPSQGCLWVAALPAVDEVRHGVVLAE